MSTPATGVATTLTLDVDGTHLEGDLAIPAGASALVVFVHGSGSSRHSPRNQHVAGILRHEGLGTFLFDLLTEEEEEFDIESGRLRFDIELLAGRLVRVLDLLEARPETTGLPVALFGASTGAAAALIAAAQRPRDVSCVISRGGRPDLAGATILRDVHAPVLLIVGGADEPVIELNEWALERIDAPSDLVIVPGATHLFEEPGALDHVARLALEWVKRYSVAGDGSQ
ncbi:MAG: dienelactone hydrolase family protein [Dehalococcoidia bacterium]|nr:dienelactone hydrolase family protein [Dehalococcoidia bacterium]